MMYGDLIIWRIIHKNLCRKIPRLPASTQQDQPANDAPSPPPGAEDLIDSSMKREKISKFSDLVYLNVDGLVKKEGSMGLKSLIMELSIKKKLTKLNQYLNKVAPIYDYNSTQMNIPNKIFKWMEIEVNYKIFNEDSKLLVESQKFPYKLKEENYVTFLYGKLKKIKN
jgi:hypothetical protein